MFVRTVFICAILLVVFSFTKITNDLEESMERGRAFYQANCVACHMEDGKGIPNVFPPLAKADYLMKDKGRAVKQILNGATGEMVVNGVTYNGAMTGFEFSDKEVADILNYIRNSWGNQGGEMTPAEVARLR